LQGENKGARTKDGREQRDENKGDRRILTALSRCDMLLACPESTA
jgi:hypothetical protein